VEFAKHVADDMAWYEHVSALPEWLRDYIALDYDKLASHMAHSYAVVEGPKKMVYIFGQT
jgi:antirestriction protein